MECGPNLRFPPPRFHAVSVVPFASRTFFEPPTLGLGPRAIAVRAYREPALGARLVPLVVVLPHHPHHCEGDRRRRSLDHLEEPHAVQPGPDVPPLLRGPVRVPLGPPRGPR